MSGDYFMFKEFRINQDRAAFKVGTDGVLLGACADLSGASRILDIGTGTGLIAIMAAQRTSALITAIEPDHGSFSQALGNVNECRWHDRIEVKNAGLKDYSETAGITFDILLTNPPYFSDSLLSPDPARSATRHTVSLTSDDLIAGALKLLTDTGSLQLILPYDEATVFIAQAAGSGLYCTSLLKIKPNPGGRIIRMIMKFEKSARPVHERFLTIETGERHHFSEEYMSATKDFYLKF